jgi:hypothetical protein
MVMGTLRSLTNYRLWSYVARDGDTWVGHCLALGLVVQGDSISDAIALLVERGENPLMAWKPSPESVKEFEFIRSHASRKCEVKDVPPDTVSAIFELLMPMPRQSEHSEWATPVDPYDGLAVPVAVAC